MAHVQVALRVRPMSAAELAEGARPIAHRVDEQVVVLRDPMADPGDVLRARRSREKSYVFDAVFDSAATQETVYRATTRGLVAGVISGCNATVFAYGPTGCGKTFTMLGTDSEPGICARTLSELFQAIEDASGDTEYEVTMSYLEIYNERIRDLLNPSPRCLQLWDDAGGTVRVAGITELSAVSTEEVMQLLARGNRQRTQEPTAANRTSSRSHAVLQVTVCQRRRRGGLRCGRLFMIDLAGSERAAQTRNRGQRMKEGAHINRSLLALGNCIKALSDPANAEYVNYRDSKLTRLLKDSLGGNSHTVMIAHISPASTAFEESRSTLTYAHRARSIRAMVRRNPLGVSCRVAQYGSVVADLRREIRRLKGQVDAELGEGERQDIPYIQAQVRPHGARPELHRVREQLRGACCEQAALRHLLLWLETPALHARHLLTRTQWGWRWGEERRGEPDGPGDGKRDSDTGAERPDVPGPPDMAVTCESTAALVEEPGRLRQRKAEPARRFRQSQQQLEEALRRRSSSEEQQEVLALLCRLHQPELELAETRSRTPLMGGLQHLPVAVAQHFNHHQTLCARIIQQQRQLIAEHGLLVPRPLEELYETYLRELAGDPGGTGTLKASGTKSLPDTDRDSVQARNREHPTPPRQGPRHDTLPPLCPTGDSSATTPVFKTTLRAQRLGSAAVPTPPPGRGAVAQELSTAVPMAPKPQELQEMPSSTRSIVAKAAQRRSCIPESACLPGPVEERGVPRLRRAASEDSLAGTATCSLGARLRAHKKGGGEPGKRGESLDGRRRRRRLRSFEVTGCRPAAPRASSPPPPTLQSREPCRQGCRQTAPQAPPEHCVEQSPCRAGCQLPASPRKGQRPQLGCVTRNGARASSKDGWGHRC